MTDNTTAFKSYCWTIGTTSFRYKYMNKSIEEQLMLLDKFWSQPENRNLSWNGEIIQSRFYYFLKSNGFLKGDANLPDKDARQKLSGSHKLGLIDQNRKLTEAGNALLKIVNSNNFKTENDFFISNDSYIFAKQLLKLSLNIEKDTLVRPFILLIYFLTKLDYLSDEEFTYFLPLCIDKDTTDKILCLIPKFRQGNVDLDKVILETVLSKQNYINAYKLFMANNVTETLICKIGMNRKSSGKGAKKYDQKYYSLYVTLKEICLNKDYNKTTNLLNDINTLKSKKAATLWKKYLFKSTNKINLKKKPEECLTNAEIFSAKDEQNLKKIFFEKLHLFKIKTNLYDCKDLNRRYFKITDMVIFNENTVKLDILPKYIFGSISDELYKSAFSYCELLEKNVKLEEISPCLKFDKQKIYQKINQDYNIDKVDDQNVKNLVENERLKRFNDLIDKLFKDNTLIKLLDYFKERSDDEITKLVPCEATIPTIFEYITAIIWYKISDRKGNILNFMKTSLDSNLMPKTHAIGGDADIIYEYEKSDDYPEHSLLLEVTLADKNSQRKMEMEPVSRHLGQYLLKNKKSNSYAIFASTSLSTNVVSDFRNRKTYVYCDDNCPQNNVEGLKIIPLATDELKTIIKTNKKYKDLYKIFEKAYHCDDKPYLWYEKNIVSYI